MKFAIHCPECKSRLQLGDKHLGKKVKCKCGAIMRLPKSLNPDSATSSNDVASAPATSQMPASPSPQAPTNTNPATTNPASPHSGVDPSLPTAPANPSSVLTEMEDDLFGDELFSSDWYKKSDDPLAIDAAPDPFGQPQQEHGLPTPDRPSGPVNNPNAAGQMPAAVNNPNTVNPSTANPNAANPNLGTPTNEVLPAAPTAPQQGAPQPINQPAYNQPVANQPIQPVPNQPVPNQPAPVPYATNLPGPNVAPASPYQDPANYATDPNAAPQNPYVMPTGPTTANIPNNQPYDPNQHGGAVQPSPTGYQMPQTPQTEYERKRQKDDALLSSYKEDTDWRNSRDDSLFGKASGYGFFAGIVLMVSSVLICSMGLVFGFIIPYTPHAFVAGFIISIVGGIKLLIDFINNASSSNRR